MAKNKKWYWVELEKPKRIRVYAEDEYEAREKAEIKMGAEWCSVMAWEE